MSPNRRRLGLNWRKLLKRLSSGRKLPAGARELRDVVNTVPAAGGLNRSSSLENFTKRIDFRTNFLAAVTLSTSMKYVRVENNHRGAFRICARTPPKG